MARDLIEALRSLRENEWKSTLGGSIVCCVDEIRSINSKLGLRPYKVFLVKLAWTGSTRGGAGVLTEQERTELLPVPKVASLSSVQLQLQSIGIDEVGDLQVSEISPTYTEFQLRGLGPNGEALAKNEEFLWEIHWMRSDGTTPIHRRYHPKAVPDYDAGRFQWTVSLVRSSTELQP